MENFITGIGGYDSWQFAVLMYGTLLGGLALRIKWIWAMPIPAFGVFLGYLALDHAVQLADIADATTAGIASTIPILFVAISIGVLFDPSVVPRMFGFTQQRNKAK